MQALREIENALSIIEIADQRALAVDGPVGHVRDTMTDAEWRKLYLSLGQAKAFLVELDGTGA